MNFIYYNFIKKKWFKSFRSLTSNGEPELLH